MDPHEQLFDGAHVAHIAAYRERQRLARIAAQSRDAFNRATLRARFAS